MRGLIAAAAGAGLLCAGIAQACDDHHGACEIEDWRWYSVADYLYIEGVATCDAGRIRIRLYEGEGDKPKFLGTAEGRIKGTRSRRSARTSSRLSRCLSSTALSPSDWTHADFAPVHATSPNSQRRPSGFRGRLRSALLDQFRSKRNHLGGNWPYSV